MLNVWFFHMPMSCNISIYIAHCRAKHNIIVGLDAVMWRDQIPDFVLCSYLVFEQA